MLTPEHLQLLSTRRLNEAVTERDPGSDETTGTRTDMARMARFELRRRACSVPVRNRYESVRWRQTEQ